MIIDQHLFHNHIWFPRDGYGFEASVPVTTVDDGVASENKLLKLHGSLNWKKERFFGPFQFTWWDDEGKAFFPGYIRDLKPPTFVYQGSHGGSRSWMLPSWIKQFEIDPNANKYKDKFRRIIKTNDLRLIDMKLEDYL